MELLLRKKIETKRLITCFFNLTTSCIAPTNLATEFDVVDTLLQYYFVASRY